MYHEMLGRLHAAWRNARDDERGQGTVEYVGVVLMIAVLIGAVAAAASGKASGLATDITDKVSDAIKDLSAGKKK